MYITDLTHFLDDSGNIATQMPKQARELAGFFALIVASATANYPADPEIETEIRCFKRGCKGQVLCQLIDDIIHWRCSDCDNDGTISNWHYTHWDFRGIE